MGRAQCGCGKLVACDVPRQGSGATYVYRKHSTPEGERCDESRRDVPVDAIISDPCGWKRSHGAL